MLAFIKTIVPFSSPATGRARPSTRSCTPGRRGFHRKSAGRRGHPGQPSDRPANRRLRPQSRDSVPRGARARKASPASAPSAHQQRQRLPPPPQTVAQPLQRRRHQEPAKLSRMAPRSRSLGRQTRTAKLDQRRDRKRTIPTDIAIRAIIADLRRALPPRRAWVARLCRDSLDPASRGNDKMAGRASI